MKITGLKPAGGKPGFIAIYGDGVRMGVLPVEEIRALGIECGAELGGEGAERLLTLLERVKAYDAAVRLLAARGRSVQEMLSRLRRKGLRPDAVEHAVGRLESEGLLDDLAFARDMARSRAARGFGRARVLADLSAKGVPRTVAERAAAEVGEDDAEARRATLLTLARKRADHLQGLEPGVARRRLAGYLGRRGYGGAEVWATVNAVLGEAANEW